MKSLINLKSNLFIFLFSLLAISISAQTDASDKGIGECETVEWNAKRDMPEINDKDLDCVTVTLVGFEKDQLQKMHDIVGSLSSNLVMMKVSDNLEELKIKFNHNPISAERKQSEFKSCFAKIKKQI